MPQTLIESVYTTGQKLYVIIIDRVLGQWWNGTGFETYNSAHWLSYAIPLTEATGSGYYSALRPVGLSSTLTSDIIYLQAGVTPTLGDIVSQDLRHHDGDNVIAINANLQSSSNLEQALSSEIPGLITTIGVISNNSFSTNLINPNTNAYAGRILLMTSGVAAGMAAVISTYTAAEGILTLTPGLAIVPSGGDAFIIV